MKRNATIQTLLKVGLVLMGIFSLESLTAGEPPIAVPGGTWEKVDALSDEFDTWDTDKWYKELWNYPAPNNMIADNAGVTDGKMWIKATLSEGDRWFNSCRVQAKTSISYPMYTECAMKASSVSALNTFWMNRGDDTNRNEIDICENNANPSGTPVKHTAEATKYLNASNIWLVQEGKNLTPNTESHNSTKDLSDGNPMKGLKMDEAYHIIGLYWENATTFHWYLDGEHVGTSVSPIDFTMNLAIQWDLWTNNWDGYAVKEHLQDETMNTMYVDYIHTYSLNQDNGDGMFITKEFTAGNESVDGYADGWSSNMVINKSDVYINNSGESLDVSVDNFNFYALAKADPLTPFVVKVNEGNDFTVLAVGTTRTNDEYELGTNTFAFTEGMETKITIADGERIAIGFLDANADGTGSGSGAVIAYTQDAPVDNLYYSGAETGIAGSVAVGSSVQNNAEILSLDRNYSFSIDFLAPDAPSAIADVLIAQETLKIYPNPATDHVFVKVEDHSTTGTLLTISNVAGIVVVTKDVSAGTDISVDVSKLAKGIYVVSVGNASAKLIIK